MSELTTPGAMLERAVAALEQIKTSIGVMSPVGTVLAFAGSTTPDGWLLCDGSAVSRTTYADLYAVIGDTYGDGDGSTTFNLPDMSDKFIQGNATSGTVKTAGLPNITGGPNNAIQIIKADKTVGAVDSGAFHVATSYNFSFEPDGESARGVRQLEFDASKSSAVYGNSTTVQPPAITMRYIIKC